MEDNVTPTCPKCDSIVRPMEEFFDDSKPPYAQFKGYYWCVGCGMWMTLQRALGIASPCSELGHAVQKADGRKVCGICGDAFQNGTEPIVRIR